MIVSTILCLVTLTTSATSSVIRHENLKGFEAELDYYLQPRSSESKTNDVQEKANEDSMSYIDKKIQSDDEALSGMYRNGKENFDGISKHDSYRVDQKERKESNDDKANISEYDEPEHENYQEERSDEIDKEQEDSNSKVSRLENTKEEQNENNEHQEEEKEKSNVENEKDNEEINAHEDSNEESDDKINENYEESEEIDEFKWPHESEWFGKYKGYDDFVGNRFGKFGKFGEYGKLGEYTGFGGRIGHSCLDLGYGEYC